MGLAAGWQDFLHATLRQESVRERQGDTQHEGEWFGLARFGLVGLAAGWKDLLHTMLRQKSVRENGKEILVWIALVWWDWQLDGRIFFMPRFTEINTQHEGVWFS